MKTLISSIIKHKLKIEHIYCFLQPYTDNHKSNTTFDSLL